MVERIHGKDEVTGSIPVRGSIWLIIKIIYNFNECYPDYPT